MHIQTSRMQALLSSHRDGMQAGLDADMVSYVGFRGPPKPAAKEKEKDKDKEPAKSESSHEMPQQGRTERAKWYANCCLLLDLLSASIHCAVCPCDAAAS